MADYVLFYHGGEIPNADDEKKFKKNWRNWVSSMGADLVNQGSGVNMSQTVMSDTAVIENGGINPITGYCIIRADSMVDALNQTKAHPILALGANIEVAKMTEIF